MRSVAKIKSYCIWGILVGMFLFSNFFLTTVEAGGFSAEIPRDSTIAEFLMKSFGREVHEYRHAILKEISYDEFRDGLTVGEGDVLGLAVEEPYENFRKVSLSGGNDFYLKDWVILSGLKAGEYKWLDVSDAELSEFRLFRLEKRYDFIGNKVVAYGELDKNIGGNLVEQRDWWVFEEYWNDEYARSENTGRSVFLNEERENAVIFVISSDYLKDRGIEFDRCEIEQSDVTVARSERTPLQIDADTVECVTLIPGSSVVKRDIVSIGDAALVSEVSWMETGENGTNIHRALVFSEDVFRLDSKEFQKVVGMVNPSIPRDHGSSMINQADLMTFVQNFAAGVLIISVIISFSYLFLSRSTKHVKMSASNFREFAKRSIIWIGGLVVGLGLFMYLALKYLAIRQGISITGYIDQLLIGVTGREVCIACKVWSHTDTLILAGLLFLVGMYLLFADDVNNLVSKCRKSLSRVPGYVFLLVGGGSIMLFTVYAISGSFNILFLAISILAAILVGNSTIDDRLVTPLGKVTDASSKMDMARLGVVLLVVVMLGGIFLYWDLGYFSGVGMKYQPLVYSLTGSEAKMINDHDFVRANLGPSEFIQSRTSDQRGSNIVYSRWKGIFSDSSSDVKYAGYSKSSDPVRLIPFETDAPVLCSVPGVTSDGFVLVDTIDDMSFYSRKEIADEVMRLLDGGSDIAGLSSRFDLAVDAELVLSGSSWKLNFVEGRNIFAGEAVDTRSFDVVDLNDSATSTSEIDFIPSDVSWLVYSYDGQLEFTFDVIEKNANLDEDGLLIELMDMKGERVDKLMIQDDGNPIGMPSVRPIRFHVESVEVGYYMIVLKHSPSVSGGNFEPIGISDLSVNSPILLPYENPEGHFDGVSIGPVDKALDHTMAQLSGTSENCRGFCDDDGHHLIFDILKNSQIEIFVTASKGYILPQMEQDDHDIEIPFACSFHGYSGNERELTDQFYVENGILQVRDVSITVSKNSEK